MLSYIILLKGRACSLLWISLVKEKLITELEQDCSRPSGGLSVLMQRESTAMDSKDTEHVGQGIQSITNYMPAPQCGSSDTVENLMHTKSHVPGQLDPLQFAY